MCHFKKIIEQQLSLLKKPLRTIIRIDNNLIQTIKFPYIPDIRTNYHHNDCIQFLLKKDGFMNNKLDYKFNHSTLDHSFQFIQNKYDAFEDLTFGNKNKTLNHNFDENHLSVSQHTKDKSIILSAVLYKLYFPHVISLFINYDSMFYDDHFLLDKLEQFNTISNQSKTQVGIFMSGTHDIHDNKILTKITNHSFFENNFIVYGFVDNDDDFDESFEENGNYHLNELQVA